MIGQSGHRLGRVQTLTTGSVTLLNSYKIRAKADNTFGILDWLIFWSENGREKQS